MKRALVALGVMGMFAAGLGARWEGQARKAPLVVHEWGTITTRHAPDGTPQGRLNRIESADTLPAFVHRYEPAQTASNPEKTLVKTPLIPGRPDVTMRLETPVIYFYLPRGSSPPAPFDVTVRFRGGVLNEFYPDAEPSVTVDVDRIAAKMDAGVIPAQWTGEVLDNYVVGRLLWRGISLADSAPGPATSSNVWLAPRRVASKSVLSPLGEGERFLFYRGVAHLEALLQTGLTANEVRLLAPQRLQWMTQSSMTIARLWLVDVRGDGAVAFRDHAPVTIEKDAPSGELARLPLFAAGDYATANVAALRNALKESLVSAGLYAPEAEAMLETWKQSYFRTPGLRLFYLVPDEWLGYFLPLQLSVPHELTRVIVGRIDLARR
ncbi:MAG TPA: hypothetical protein VGH98_18450 [Gemmatimonadaceae bacterium]|jgi:hypothetical protein